MRMSICLLHLELQWRGAEAYLRGGVFLRRGEAFFLHHVPDLGDGSCDRSLMTDSKVLLDEVNLALNLSVVEEVRL